MTSKEVAFTFGIGVLVCFAFWIISPSLDRLREKWRARSANSSPTPEEEGNLLKQLRMQEASLERLERFRKRPIDRLLYMTQLLAFGLLMFMLTVYVYALKLPNPVPLLSLPASLSVLFTVLAVAEGRNMTDSKIESDINKLKEHIQTARTKLKLPD